MIKYDWLRSNSPFIRGMIKEGYSRTKIYEISRKQGWGIRKTDALETIRYYVGEKTKARDAWKSTPLKYKPSESKIPQFEGITAKRFLAEVEVKRKHIITGEEDTKVFRLGFEDLMSRGTMEDKIREIGARAGVSGSDPNFNVTDISKVEIFKSQFA